jgi:chromosome segregation ATPase
MEDRNTRVSESPDLLNQLREKIRIQATRLRSLEQYRILCEQRISEISPGHQFPVRADDLGTGLSASLSQELTQAKQKISRLEQQLQSSSIKVPLGENYTFPPPTTQLSLAQLQELYSAIYYQHHDLLKEKSAVEESLRAEMLTCEEQRAYIEVLKQTLESNLQDLGLSGRNFQEFLARPDGKLEKNEKNEKIEMNYSQEILEIKELLKVKIQECEVLVKEREKADKHLKEAAEALQYAEEEVERLEEEKESLLDYIDENSRKEKEHQEVIEKLNRRCEGLESQVNQSMQGLQSEASARRDFESEKQSEIDNYRSQLQTLTHKNETLQVNNTTLSNMLKETQSELDTLKQQHESSLKELSTIRKSISSSDSKLEEALKTSQKYQETIKELDSKLIKSEKDLKTFKERKLKEIENDFQVQTDQLSQEIQELRLELQQSKDKEQLLLKDLTDSRKKLKKFLQDSEKNQVIANQSGQDLLSLKQQLEASQIELRQASFEKDKLLSDLQRLDFDLKSSKTSSLLLEEELSSAKNKLEDQARNLKNLSDASREKENKLQNSCFELDNLKKNLQVVLKDLESERNLKVQYYEEVIKLKKSQTSLSQSGSTVEQCKKFIEDFACNFGAISAASNNFSQVVSSQFKDIVFKSNESTNIDLQTWIQCACEELEALIRRLAEYRQDLTMTAQKLQNTQHRLDSLSLDEGALRDRERSLRMQVEQLSLDKEKLQTDREVLNAKVQNLQSELAAVKKDVQVGNEESQRLRDQLNYTSTETIQWRNTAESDIFAIRAVEEKANLLLKEKKELETLLSKLQSAVPSSDLQRIFLELMKIHSELEVVNRERLRIENQLLRSESEMRSLSRNHQQDKALFVRKEVESLRSQLCNCDSQIMSFKRRALSLDEELKETEKIERRRSVLNLENEKSYVLDYQKDIFDVKRRQDSTDKAASGLLGYESLEDRPVLSYFDKLRRAKNLVSDLREQE